MCTSRFLMRRKSHVILRLQVGSVFTTSDADLGADLDPDHRLLLRFVQHVAV